MTNRLHSITTDGNSLYMPNESVDILAAVGPIANSTTETTILTLATPSSAFRMGGTYRWRIAGTSQNTGTPTLTFKLRNSGKSVTYTTGTLTFLAANGADKAFVWEGTVTMRDSTHTVAESSGTSNGYLASGTAHALDIPPDCTVTASGIGSGFLVTATWGTADAANTFTVQSAYLGLVRP